MELQVMSTKDFDIEKVKQEVATQLEKYRELVVTEDNYEDMQKARREVVNYRTNLTKFGTEQKRLLKKPYDEFVSTLKEVLLEVDRVESPLNKQFEYFDNIKKEEKTAKINEEISRLGELYGVREEYLSQLVHEPKWLNKTAKFNDTKSDLDHIIQGLKSKQDFEDREKELIAEKRTTLEMYIEVLNANYGLNTPFTISQLWGRLADVPLAQAQEILKNMFEERLTIELEAQRVKEERAIVEEVAEKPKPEVKIPTESAAFKDTWTVNVFRLNEQQLGELQEYLEHHNLSYEVY